MTEAKKEQKPRNVTPMDAQVKAISACMRAVRDIPVERHMAIWRYLMDRTEAELNSPHRHQLPFSHSNELIGDTQQRKLFG